MSIFSFVANREENAYIGWKYRSSIVHTYSASYPPIGIAVSNVLRQFFE